MPQCGQQLDTDVGCLIGEVAQHVRAGARDIDCIADTRGEQRHGRGERSMRPRQITRRAQSALGLEWVRYGQPAQTDGFSLLGDWRRSENSGADREPSGPLPVTRQRREPRTEKRAALAVHVDASAR